MSNHCIYKFCLVCGVAYCELCGDTYKANSSDVDYMETEPCVHCE